MLFKMPEICIFSMLKRILDNELLNAFPNILRKKSLKGFHIQRKGNALSLKSAAISLISLKG